MNARKTAVVLLNLGGPDSARAIKPFLRNFFTDRNIIPLPWLLRRIIAEIIAWKRSRKEAGDSYGLLGGKSPLLENTRAQAKALEDYLNVQSGRAHEYRVFVCMRYWHPMTEEVVDAVQVYDPDHVVLLPLYPQYSTTTTRSSFQQWRKFARRLGLNKPTSSVCCYPSQPGWIAANAAQLAAAYTDAAKQAKAKGFKQPRILFSAHGLPEDVIKGGDPYQWQCEKSAEAIIAQMNIEGVDWQVCYQSRVGPKKWIGPSTEEALEEAARDQTPVVILPHAFVSEHVETLVEIEIEYREFAHEIGVPIFVRVPTVATHPLFIAGLADMTRAQEARGNVSADNGGCICPDNFNACCQRDQSALLV